MSEFITVKEAPEKAPVIYKYLKDEPASVVPGVAARDLTAYDLASYGPGQRIQIDIESRRDGGAYKKVGTVPKGLSLDPEDAVVPQAVEPQPDTAPADEPASKTGKKG
jgi:hypothetical protein